MVRNSIVTVAARRITLNMVAGVLCFSGIAAAQTTDDITLRLDATTANAGDTVEVTLTMTINSDAPESMIVFLAYDPDTLTPKTDEYELIVRNSVTGDPVLDDNGNAITERKAVLPSDAVTGADKTVDSEVFADEGVVGVSVTGLNTTVIPEGLLFTVAFSVAGGLSNGLMTDVIGLNDDNAILVPDGSGGVVPASTSASRSVETETGAVAVTYAFEDLVVSIGCDPPEVPTNITASQDRSDGVLIGWSAVATTGAEYRVYRNTTNNNASAVALGTVWQSSTTFTDITAQVPEVVAGDGCTTPSQVNEVRYFYWVQARTAAGCQGELSATSAEGFRVQAKQFAAAGMIPMAGVSGTSLVYGMALFLLLLWRRGRRNLVYTGR